MGNVNELKMEERKLVTFEQAKKLKELGYRGWSSYGFKEDVTVVFVTDSKDWNSLPDRYCQPWEDNVLNWLN